MRVENGMNGMGQALLREQEVMKSRGRRELTVLEFSLTFPER